MAPEIVRLGEAYSIVTEYTSFLVLENDAAFQRWKIARKNVLRSDRDRKAQETVRAEFEKMRSKAMADLGPQTKEVKLAAAAQRSRSLLPRHLPDAAERSTAPPPAPSSSSQPSRSVDFNLGGGSGPVGPLLLGLIAAMRMFGASRRKQ